MMADLTALGNDGIRRSFDEHYGTMMYVEQDPTGAMWAIHKQADRIEELEAKLAEVEAERDAFASNIPDAAQNLIRNAHTGRLKALHRAVVAEAELAHLENHIEATAKDTHSTMLQYEAALPAVYRLGLENASRIVSNAGHSLHVEIDYLPTPTAVELMARIQKGEKK